MPLKPLPDWHFQRGAILEKAKSEKSLSVLAAEFGVEYRNCQKAILGKSVGAGVVRYVPKVPIQPVNARYKYKEISPQVVKMREELKLTLAEIASQLNVSVNTVERAVDFAKDKQTHFSSTSKFRRNHVGQLGTEKYSHIDLLIRKGIKAKEIAAQIGCGIETVRLRKKKIIKY